METKNVEYLNTVYKVSLCFIYWHQNSKCYSRSFYAGPETPNRSNLPRWGSGEHKPGQTAPSLEPVAVQTEENHSLDMKHIQQFIWCWRHLCKQRSPVQRKTKWISRFTRKTGANVTSTSSISVSGSTTSVKCVTVNVWANTEDNSSQSLSNKSTGIQTHSWLTIGFTTV